MEIKHLIFDLDDTLYPQCGAMNKGINQRIISGVAEFFGITYEEAALKRQENIVYHSTTLEWLRNEGLADVEWWFSHMHPENEADELEYDPNLPKLLESIKIPKIILTNSPMEHAVRVLEKLKISRYFDQILDLRKTKMLGKPYPTAYYIALESVGGSLCDTLFIDDLVKYTQGWELIGGTAVLVGKNNGKPINSSIKKLQNELSKLLPSEKGRTFNIDSVYELPELLHKIDKKSI